MQVGWDYHNVVTAYGSALAVMSTNCRQETRDNWEKEKQQRTKVDMAGGGERRKKKHTGSRVQEIKQTQDGGEKHQDVHLTFLSQKKTLSENSSSMRTHELHAGGGRASQGSAAVGSLLTPGSSLTLTLVFICSLIAGKKMKTLLCWPIRGEVLLLQETH